MERDITFMALKRREGKAFVKRCFHTKFENCNYCLTFPFYLSKGGVKACNVNKQLVNGNGCQVISDL